VAPESGPHLRHSQSCLPQYIILFSILTAFRVLSFPLCNTVHQAYRQACCTRCLTLGMSPVEAATAAMLTEKIRPSFVLFHTTPFSTSNVHITIPVNGIIRITFSMHSVVSCLSPFTVSQMPQPPITSDKGFIHTSRFNSVRNRIIEVTKTSKNNFLKKEDTLNAVNHVWIAAFQPFPASDG